MGVGKVIQMSPGTGDEDGPVGGGDGAAAGDGGVGGAAGAAGLHGVVVCVWGGVKE